MVFLLNSLMAELLENSFESIETFFSSQIFNMKRNYNLSENIDTYINNKFLLVILMLENTFKSSKLLNIFLKFKSY